MGHEGGEFELGRRELFGHAFAAHPHLLCGQPRFIQGRARRLDVSIDDLATVLDPGGSYSAVVNGILARGSDGVHITAAGVENLIEPALNQIIANVAGAVYAGSA